MSLLRGRIGRRQFVRGASGVAALGFIGSVFPGSRWSHADEPDAVAGESGSLDESELRILALAALDAARGQGAQFADVRINLSRILRFAIEGSRGVRVPVREASATFGVRVLAKGAWGFAGGVGLTTDNVAGMARLAVERAKSGQTRDPGSVEFAPAPVVRDGRWGTPIEIDPFDVPLREQEELVLHAIEAAEKLKGENASGKAVLRSLSGGLTWIKSERIFASTEGSLVSQRTYTALPEARASSRPKDDWTIGFSVPVDTLLRGGYGYEAVSKSNLKDEWRKAAEESLRIASLPIRSVDVGRYDVVISPGLMAVLVRDTIGRALELDRARGDKANDAGTTYAMPPAEILGEYRLGSALLTITCDRSRPHANATVGWDEEGVEPEEFTLVREGTVVDYITTRTTAPALAEWYASQKKPVRSHGCAARTGSARPMLQLPNLTIQPGRADADVEELIKDVKRGFYVVGGSGSVDQQLLNAQYGASLAYEIRNGKVVGLARDMAFQFSTPQFWKSLDALGGEASSSLENVRVDLFDPDRVTDVGVHSVPARFRNVNVVNTGKRA